MKMIVVSTASSYTGNGCVIEQHSADVWMTLEQIDEYTRGGPIVLCIEDAASKFTAIFPYCANIHLKPVPVRPMWLELSAVGQANITDSELPVVQLAPLIPYQ